MFLPFLSFLVCSGAWPCFVNISSNLLIKKKKRSCLCLFCIASQQELQLLELILLVFERLLRLRVNLNKSALFGINISQLQTSRLGSLIDYVVSELLLSHLGLSWW